jgi:hypothetical protein
MLIRAGMVTAPRYRATGVEESVVDASGGATLAIVATHRIQDPESVRIGGA